MEKKSNKGWAMIGGGVAIFVVCSIIQALADSSMFSMSYYETGNFVIDMLVNVTFYPGWILTVILILAGIVSLLGKGKAAD